MRGSEGFTGPDDEDLDDEDLDAPADPLEEAVSGILKGYSQRVTRRGLLRRTGRLCLAALGGSAAVALVPKLAGPAYANPVPGLGYDPSTWHHCAGWNYCNMCGYSCDCCNGSLGINSCPSCGLVSRYWTGCCTNPDGNRKQVRYWDCKRNTCSDATIAQCYDCFGCNNGCNQPFWKVDGQDYVCTVVRVQSIAC